MMTILAAVPGSDTPPPPPPPLGPPPRRADTTRPRILVVDDEIDIREALEWTLLGAGYEVATADSGRAAVEQALGGRFDLVVTDLRMPGMSGGETITALKALHPGLHVVVATGYFADDTADDCRRRGAEAFIRKPFDLEALLALVHQVLGRA